MGKPETIEKMSAVGGGIDHDHVELEEGHKTQQQHIDTLEEKLGDPLTEDQVEYLLSSEDVRRAIMKDQVVEQQERLKELTSLLELIKELNENTHGQSDKLDETSARVDKACTEYIASGVDDLSSANRNALERSSTPEAMYS